MGTVLALLPSPLLGPAVWQPVAARLRDEGWEVAVPGGRGDTPTAVLTSYLDGIPAGRDVVLIPHSNAGLYVPALTAERQVTGLAFVDAGLPPPEGVVELAPPAFLDFLKTKADADGVLPPWTQWWDDADLAGLFPDADTRSAVEAEQQRLPLGYFQQSLPVPAGWDERPAAYLAFGDTYAAELQDASNRGWPITVLPGEHLHQLINPGQVAEAISAVLTLLDDPS